MLAILNPSLGRRCSDCRRLARLRLASFVTARCRSEGRHVSTLRPDACSACQSRLLQARETPFALLSGSGVPG